MTESNAYLAYGITVTTESLLYAVAAWPRLQGPFAFLDLVALRRRKGTLATARPQESGATRSAVEQVPLEAWELVRHKVVDLELREAEIEHVKEYMCGCFKAQGLTAEDLSWNDTVAACPEYMPPDEDGLAFKRYLAAMPLLWHFRLGMPALLPVSAYLLDKAPFFGQLDCNPNTATRIAVPGPVKAVHIHPTLLERVQADDCPVICSFSTPPVPPDADERLHRLVSTMHLQPVNTLHVVKSEYILRLPDRSPGESVGEKREFKKVGLGELAPRWRLSPLWAGAG